MFFEPTSGHILFDGRDIVGMSRQEKEALRAEIGTVFQGSALFDSYDGSRQYYVSSRYVYQPYFTEKKNE